MHHQASISRQRGLKLFEVMLLVSVIGLLAGVSVDRILALRADVERTMVQQAIDTMNAGLATQSAQHILERREETLQAMRHANPIRLLANQDIDLDGYTGERFGPDPSVLEPGQWYFDQRNRMLVYRVRYPQRLDTPLSGPARLRFRVELDNRQGSSLARLEPVESYQWR